MTNNTKSRSLTVCLLFSLLGGGLAGAGEPLPPQVLIRYDLYRIVGHFSGKTSLDEVVWAGDKPPDAELKKAVTLFLSSSLEFQDGKLEAGPDGWTWNGKPIDEARLPPKRIVKIGTPRILVIDGERAAFEVVDTAKLQYFEKREDGLFELREEEADTGIKVATTVQCESSGSVLLSDFLIELRAVEDRLPIPGVRLPVGRPLINVQKCQFALRVEPGKNYGLLLSPHVDGGLLAMRLRVEMMKPPQSGAAKKAETPPPAKKQ